LLVENGSRVNENGGRAKGFGSSLHILCETNQTSHLLSVARYLVESGSIVNLRDDKNNTVLHLLSRYNQTDHLLPVIRFLVEAGFTGLQAYLLVGIVGIDSVAMRAMPTITVGITQCQQHH
jgi:ankyrin repeat protein